jgi:hypothetical protein
MRPGVKGVAPGIGVASMLRAATVRERRITRGDLVARHRSLTVAALI